MAELVTATTATPPRRRPPVARLLLTLVAKVIADPIRNGRMRDVDWPYGLRLIVGLGSVSFAIGALVVVFSSLIRRSGELSVASTLSASIPRGYVWLLIWLVLVALAMFQTAALHTTWWLRLVSVIASATVMGTWGIRSAQFGAGLVGTGLTGLLIVGLAVLVVIRRRRRFAWWEFPLVLTLLAGPIVLGLWLLGQDSRPLGYDFAPVYLQTMVTFLGPVALPAVVAAGLSVAEISVSTTLWATRLTERFAARRLGYLILAVLLALRLGQTVVQIIGWDFIQQGWNVIVTWVLLATVLALLSAAVLRIGRRQGRPAVSELPDRMAQLALPLGVAMVGVGFGAVVLVGLVALHLVRHSLTRQRAVALSGAVVLSALLGSHDFISDPVGALLGFSGAALVLFGLTWDLLTDSDFANRGSNRFPIPSRVMLMLANVILAIAILAYTCLVRDPSATVNLDAFATLGDEVLGTALMAAAFVAVLSAVRQERAID
jgi:hypothetical protein